MEEPCRGGCTVLSFSVEGGITARTEIDTARRAKAAASNNPLFMDLSRVAPQPQDFDTLSKGKSKGKGTDRAKQLQNYDGKDANSGEPKKPCPFCGKLGHRKLDCR